MIRPNAVTPSRNVQSQVPSPLATFYQARRHSRDDRKHISRVVSLRTLHICSSTRPRVNYAQGGLFRDSTRKKRNSRNDFLSTSSPHLLNEHEGVLTSAASCSIRSGTVIAMLRREKLVYFGQECGHEELAKENREVLFWDMGLHEIWADGWDLIHLSATK